jgi:hypothetical protein
LRFGDPQQIAAYRLLQLASDVEGFGAHRLRCGECDGDGIHECECGDQHNCGGCDGSGYNDIRIEEMTVPEINTVLARLREEEAQGKKPAVSSLASYST